MESGISVCHFFQKAYLMLVLRAFKSAKTSFSDIQGSSKQPKSNIRHQLLQTDFVPSGIRNNLGNRRKDRINPQAVVRQNRGQPR